MKCLALMIGIPCLIFAIWGFKPMIEEMNDHKSALHIQIELMDADVVAKR